jgi:hypothetical protein
VLTIMQLRHQRLALLVLPSETETRECGAEEPRGGGQGDGGNVQ